MLEIKELINTGTNNLQIFYNRSSIIEWVHIGASCGIIIKAVEDYFDTILEYSFYIQADCIFYVKRIVLTRSFLQGND